MKIKKGLALILALAMIITLMPTMAFAQSTNTASKVVNVAPEDEMPAIELNIETKDPWTAQKPQKIKVTLENAEWTGNRPTSASLNPVNPEDKAILTVDHNAANVDKDGVTGPNPAEKIELNLGFIASGSNTLEFTITPDYELPDGTDVTLTFAKDAITSGSEAGDVNIAIESIESDISDSTIKVATVVTSTTTTTVTGDVKTFPRGDVDSTDINTTIEISQLKFLYPLKTLVFPAFLPPRFGPFPSFFPLREEMRETFFRPSLPPYPAALRKFAWPLW